MLLAHIELALRRGSTRQEPQLQHGDFVLDAAARVLTQSGREVRLCCKEFGIMEYMMRRPNDVVSQAELTEHVWGGRANEDSHTVRSHMWSLRRKLREREPDHEHIESVAGAGYRLRR